MIMVVLVILTFICIFCTMGGLIAINEQVKRIGENTVIAYDNQVIIMDSINNLYKDQEAIDKAVFVYQKRFMNDLRLAKERNETWEKEKKRRIKESKDGKDEYPCK